MFKKSLSVLIAAGLAAALHCGTAAAGEWEPTKTVEWLLTVNPGGGNDMFTRAIIDILKEKGISRADFVINYMVDGHGEVARHAIATAGPDPYKILGWVGGDCNVMRDNGNFTLDNFSMMAILASDRQVLIHQKNGKYKTLDDFINAVKEGKTVSVGGSRGDDEVVFHLMMKELGLSEDTVPFIAFGSNVDALTALLGNHIDLAVSKLAPCRPYLLSGDFSTIVAFAKGERFKSPPFDTTPILSEFGYKDVEYPNWRAIFGSPDMPKEAYDYYVKIFKAVSETPEWAAFLEKQVSTPMSYFGPEVKEYAVAYEAEMP